MKVRVKAEVCVGHAMCLLACAAIFQQNDEDGHAFVVADAVPAHLEDAVLQAASGCPEGAIEIF